MNIETLKNLTAEERIDCLINIIDNNSNVDLYSEKLEPEIIEILKYFKDEIQLILTGPFIIKLNENEKIIGSNVINDRKDSNIILSSLNILHETSPNGKYKHHKWDRQLYPSELVIDSTNNKITTPEGKEYSYIIELKN